MKVCYYCLGGDGPSTGDVNRYKSVDAERQGGWYHDACAPAVGYNEWDKED